MDLRFRPSPRTSGDEAVKQGPAVAAATPHIKAATLRADLAMLVVWTSLTAACFAVPLLNGDSDPGDAFTRNTARLMVALYGMATLLMTQLHGDAWRGATGRGRAARWCRILGAVTFYVHVATAYHFIHRWSHAHAVQHTQEVSGVGAGIYVSHAFGLLWLLDAAWWQERPRSYAARSWWIGGLLHAFMAFVVFNGAVVYERGPIRGGGAVLFLALAVLLARRCLQPAARRDS